MKKANKQSYHPCGLRRTDSLATTKPTQDRLTCDTKVDSFATPPPQQQLLLLLLQLQLLTGTRAHLKILISWQARVSEMKCRFRGAGGGLGGAQAPDPKVSTGASQVSQQLRVTSESEIRVTSETLSSKKRHCSRRPQPATFSTLRAGPWWQARPVKPVLTAIQPVQSRSCLDYEIPDCDGHPATATSCCSYPTYPKIE